MEHALLSRRNFCIKAATASFGLAFPGILMGVKAAGHEVSIDLTLGANSALTKVGGAMYVILPSTGDKMIVVRNSPTEVSAFTSVCTHMGCEVGLPVSGVATCPCHGSQYSDKGIVIKGPAIASLKKYDAMIQGNFIYIDSASLSAIAKPDGQGSRELLVFWRQENKTINIVWRDGSSTNARVTLFDFHGKQAGTWHTTGGRSVSLPMNHLANGEYVLKIEGTGIIPIERMIRVF
jgi:nitrite reductase/ring-hydroxylating ferredoxin subunit